MGNAMELVVDIFGIAFMVLLALLMTVVIVTFIVTFNWKSATIELMLKVISPFAVNRRNFISRIATKLCISMGMWLYGTSRRITARQMWRWRYAREHPDINYWVMIKRGVIEKDKT